MKWEMSDQKDRQVKMAMMVNKDHRDPLEMKELEAM